MIARDHAPLWRLWPWALRRLGALRVFGAVPREVRPVDGFVFRARERARERTEQ